MKVGGDRAALLGASAQPTNETDGLIARDPGSGWERVCGTSRVGEGRFVGEDLLTRVLLPHGYGDRILEFKGRRYHQLVLDG